MIVRQRWSVAAAGGLRCSGAFVFGALLLLAGPPVLPRAQAAPPSTTPPSPPSGLRTEGHDVSPAGRPAMVDALGDTLAAGPWPRRIISLSPNLTEILFAVGVDSGRIAGVTRYCDYPPAATRRPRVGGIIDPSLEAIQMINPDLVLAARGNPREVQKQIRALGFPVFAVEDRTGLAGIEQIIRQVVALTGPDRPATADSLLARIKWDLSAFRAWADSIPE